MVPLLQPRGKKVKPTQREENNLCHERTGCRKGSPASVFSQTPALYTFFPLFLHKGKKHLPGDVGVRFRTLVDLTLLLVYSVIDLGYIL